MLTNGERQVAPVLSGIRRDHLARYEFVAAQLPKGSRILDIACGVGYGAKILADAGHTVVAVDASAEAIAYGLQHYADPSIEFVVARAEQFQPERGFDAIISFETIEHIKDPAPLLKQWARLAPALFASVPNEALFPHEGRIAFHFRHYTRAQFAALLSDAGWSVTAWHGQSGPHSEVEPNREGRTLIAAATSAPRSTAEAPAHVAIVGLGPSCATFFEVTRRLGGVSAYCDEVWGINAIGDVLRCDRIFHMDDLKVQEVRAAAKPDGNIAAMVRWLKTHPGPIYTSRLRAGYPGLVEFPIEDVLNAKADGSNGGAPYFNSTAAYAIAFAIHIGVKQISLFGLDYTLANSHHAEQGRACVEFWLGIAAARGIEISIPDSSSLMDACATDRDRLYGYDCVDVAFETGADNRLSLSFTEREAPTAEEIEARYDHAKHPNRLVSGD